MGIKERLKNNFDFLTDSFDAMLRCEYSPSVRMPAFRALPSAKITYSKMSNLLFNRS